MNVTGLEPDTKYYYWAYAENGLDENTSSRDYFRTEECLHNEGVYTYPYPESISYIDTDSATQHKEIWYYNECCNKCNEVVNAEAVTETYYRDHTWVNDVCKYCRYALVCQHNNTYREYYKTLYKNITETTHTRTEYYYVICEDCGEQLDGYDWDTYKNEEHTFKNNVCTKCGYERVDTSTALTLKVTVSKTEAVVGEHVSVTPEATGGAGEYKYSYEVYENGVLVNSHTSEPSYGYSAQNAGELYFKVTVVDADGNRVTVNSDVITITEEASTTPEVTDIEIYAPSEGEWVDRLDPPSVKWAAVDTADAYWVSIYNSEDVCLSTTKCVENTLSLLDKLPTAASYYRIEIYAYDNNAKMVGTGSSYFYTNAEKPIVATGGASNSTVHSIELSMSVIRNGGNAITECGFYLGSSANALTQKYRIDGTIEKGEYSLTIDDLEEGTIYYYQAYAVNEVGEERGTVYAFSTSSASMPLVVSPTVLTFAGNAGNDKVSVNSDGEWEVTILDGEDWILVNRQYGYANKTITISVTQNNTSVPRSGIVEVTDDTGSETIVIEQSGDVVSTLKVDTENVSVGADKVVVETIQISSNDDWNVTSKASWIAPSVGYGRFDGIISLTIQANTSSVQRTGQVEIVCGDITHTITVTQKAPSRPHIQNFVNTYTVTANEKFHVQGVVVAADGGKLEKVTIRSIDDADVSVSVYLQDTETYDLSNLAAFDTAARPIHNAPGTYTYAIYALANNFAIAENEIGRFTVTVNEIPLEDAKVSLSSATASATSVTVKGKIDTLGSYAFEECGVILHDATKTQIDKVTLYSYPKNNTGIFTAQFNGLTAGTTYYYSCYLKAGGYTYSAFQGYKSIITNDAKIQDILFDVGNGYYNMGSDIYVNTGEQFDILITQQPSTAIVEDYRVQLDPSEGTEIVQGRSSLIVINNAGDYTLTVTLIGDDGIECTKNVAVHAESESLVVSCVCQQNYSEPAKNSDEAFQNSFTLKPTYRGSYFTQSSYSGYNHELAKLALGLCVAGYTTNEHDPKLNYKDLEISGNLSDDINNQDYYDRIRNMVTAYDSLGIELDDMHFYGYEESLNSDANNVAFSIAKKYATVDGEDRVILFVVLRGGGYGCEWASNFEVGEDGVFSKAFMEAAWLVYEELLDYINNLSVSEQEKLKILVTGYSRAAATANLTTFYLNDMASAVGGVDADDIF